VNEKKKKKFSKEKDKKRMTDGHVPSGLHHHELSINFSLSLSSSFVLLFWRCKQVAKKLHIKGWAGEEQDEENAFFLRF
jgi:hypothetical protein